jgi:hypothetical protein
MVPFSDWPSRRVPPPKKEDMIHVTVQFLGGRGGECNVVYVGGGKRGGGKKRENGRMVFRKRGYERRKEELWHRGREE